MREAPKMAAHYRNHCSRIDQIVSSPANRAKATALQFSKEFGLQDEQFILNRDIYEAHPDTLMKIISNFESHWNHVILFGHNPGISYLISLLTSELINVPTCSIAEISLHIEDWTHVTEGIGNLDHYDFPKNHLEMQ